MNCNWNGYSFGQPERPKQMMQLLGDGTNHVRNGQGSIGSGYLGNPDIASPINSNTPYSYPGDSTILSQATTENGRILPGVGISATSFAPSGLITLSYAGTGAENKPRSTWNGNLSSVKSHFTDASNFADYVDHILFINMITQPGSIWRWKEDPGQVVYRTLPLSSASVPGVNNSTWAANEFDSIDNLPGVSLYNYATFADYAVSHVVNNRVYGAISGTQLYGDGGLTIQNMASCGIQNYGREHTGVGPSTAAAAAYFTQQTADKDGIAAKEKSEFPRMSLTQKKWPRFTGRWDSASNKRRRFTIHCAIQPGNNAVAGRNLTTSGS
jgi:hypothetical protein